MDGWMGWWSQRVQEAQRSSVMARESVERRKLILFNMVEPTVEYMARQSENG